MATEPPRWERGMRCHGFWVGPHCLGHVGKPAPTIGGGRGDKYFYSYFPNQTGAGSIDGEVDTLKQAKKKIEELHKIHGEKALAYHAQPRCW